MVPARRRNSFVISPSWEKQRLLELRYTAAHIPPSISEQRETRAEPELKGTQVLGLRGKIVPHPIMAQSKKFFCKSLIF
jgi:hypothetical protein